MRAHFKAHERPGEEARVDAGVGARGLDPHLGAVEVGGGLARGPAREVHHGAPARGAQPEGDAVGARADRGRPDDARVVDLELVAVDPDPGHRIARPG